MIWYGGRISILIGGLATVISTFIAVVVGAFSGVAPACSKMIKSRVGILKNISVNLMISSSSLAGATPLKAPTTTAIKVVITEKSEVVEG